MQGTLKSLRPLWVNLARNRRYEAYIVKRDITEFEVRFENEGLHFLTHVLPLIGKALDNFHSSQQWTCPSGFKTSLCDVAFPMDDRSFPAYVWGKVEIPLFLGKAVRQALKGDSLAVDCVRQLSLIFYKLEVDYDSETEAKFLNDFKIVDQEVGNFDIDQVTKQVPWLIRDMRAVIDEVLRNLDPLDIRPYHGSGATACRTANWDKWHKLRYYEQLDAVFPYSDYFFYNYTHLSDEYSRLEEAPFSTPCARVVLVPKDSRGPRIISCEPAELMYIQQGLMGSLYERLQTHPLTRGLINFVDQTKNRSLARFSSMSGEFCTLDLNEASDRVSLKLVRAVFPPIWVEALEACRSTHTILPDGSVVELNKFAPMGSSCCFPVEALVFWACAYAIMHRHYRLKTENVYVYGDDMVIPSDLTDGVTKGLEDIGLKVNVNKTFRKGPFRESCGGDYHIGFDVTPVRVRKIPSDIGTGIATNSDLANCFIAKFGETDSLSLIHIIEEALGYVFPRSELPLPGVIRSSAVISNDVFFRRRFNKHLQRFEHRILAYVAPVSNRRSPAWCELLRKELSRGRQRDTYARFSDSLTSVIEPGDYADPYSARKKWAWTWLG